MISVIIPTYNEENTIAALVTYLLACPSSAVSEIIVSDGGSTDKTIAEAKTAGASAFVSPIKGRAAQMNYGASLAQGNILYFVHADTFPPQSFENDIRNAVSSGYFFGRYRTKFYSRLPILKINAFFTRYDWFICYGGDQTLFITKELFETISGFAQEMLIMEDYEIVTRAKKIAKYKIFNKSALVSARKYEKNSWLRVQLANRKIVNMYRAGAAQQDMIAKYRALLDYS